MPCSCAYRCDGCSNCQPEEFPNVPPGSNTPEDEEVCEDCGGTGVDPEPILEVGDMNLRLLPDGSFLFGNDYEHWEVSRKDAELLARAILEVTTKPK